MDSDQKLANVVGAKSARACDNCIKKRARWYCAADDAFLCQICDSSVHSANPLARRHERVRLKTSSIKDIDEKSVPKWHQGFTKKARTPRGKKQVQNPTFLVPEICSEDNSESEEQLLYRVPIFDPFVGELCNSNNNSNEGFGVDQSNKGGICNEVSDQEMIHLHGFLPSEMDLADFAADVESLLGKGLDEEMFDMEGLGLLDCDEKVYKEYCNNSLGSERLLKVEESEVVFVEENNHMEIDLGRETFELNFDYDSPINGEEEEDYKGGVGGENLMNNFEDYKMEGSKKKSTFLRLDFEGVISAWDDQKSPWTNGERPELDSCDCWPGCMGTSCGTQHVYGDTRIMMSGHGATTAMTDGGREARVSRYREKRRTRLFSKKIRYEVRKLNAEKRPRMKGRFVKRSNFVTTATPFPLIISTK